MAYSLLALLIVPAKSLAADRLIGLHSAQVMSQSMPWIAQEAGLFKKYDLDFRLVFIPSSPVATAATLNGDAEIGVTGAVGNVRAYVQGFTDLVFIAGMKNILTHSVLGKPDMKRPEDLKGKKVGLPEYQLTANVWARAILQDDHGVKPSDIHWIRGGIEDAERPEKISIKLPADVKLEDAPRGKSISTLLKEGAIDGFIAPRPPSLPADTANVGWLFSDPVAAAKDYFKRTGIFPIMHLVGVRRTLADKHPWLPGAVFKAFDQAKRVALDQLSDTSATKVTLPFVEERLVEVRSLMGDDFWSYGVAANRKTLETFLRHHHSQGLSARLVTVEEMFHPGTLESFKL